MRLLNTRITRFRFADLTIQGIPASAKLVVLAGPNGSGKSSLFDTLLLRYRMDTGYGWNGDTKYYNRPQEPAIDLGARISVTTDGSNSFARGGLYVRTAYRNDHEFATNTLSRQGANLDNVTLNRLIEPASWQLPTLDRLALNRNDAEAREMYDADPTSVAFIDFNGHDFDQVITLSPGKPTRAFWEEVMHVALDDLAALVAPKQVVICEGNPTVCE